MQFATWVIVRLTNIPVLRMAGMAVIFSLAVGCATTSAPTAVDEPPAESGDYFHEALHWSRNSAEHRAIFEQTYRQAITSVEALSEGREAGTWAVSLDADETLIDNSTYQLEIGERGEAFGPESWNEWINKMSAPALPGAVIFTRRVKQLGGVIAVVTNRRTHQCGATAENLQSVGLWFDVVLCREESGEKEPRWEALQSGSAADWPDAQVSAAWEPRSVEILVWVGDNIGDFPDQTQDMRTQQAALAGFGSRFFVLPNPMYGSWEANPKE